MDGVISIDALTFPWKTQDPFLFCAYHKDFYPHGNRNLGPDESLVGRNIGQDFQSKDGWNMYHGENIPGFPAHPHAGFETVTLVLQGLVDHSDSLGSVGRFGEGDVQWMTAGRGVQHSEMFPLLNKEKPNTLELFQIWLNLPKENKNVEPNYKMLWSEDIPKIVEFNNENNITEILLVAGKYKNKIALEAPPNSWAADPQNEVNIWIINLDPGAHVIMPKLSVNTTKSLFFFEGQSLTIAGKGILRNSNISLSPEKEQVIINGEKASQLLFLSGKKIDETIFQYGPFVTNSREEMESLFKRFQEDEFGGWPWPSLEHTHSAEMGRFARFSDGTQINK